MEVMQTRRVGSPRPHSGIKLVSLFGPGPRFDWVNREMLIWRKARANLFREPRGQANVVSVYSSHQCTVVIHRNLFQSGQWLQIHPNKVVQRKSACEVVVFRWVADAKRI